MAELTINFDDNIREVAKRLEGEQHAVTRAASRTINRLATQARTQFSREIRKVYNVRARDVSAAIRIVQRAKPNSLLAVVQASGTPVSLAHFSAKQTKRGVTFRVLKGGPRKLMKSAFILQKPGGPVVFARGRYAGNQFVFTPSPAPRLPITKLVGPSIPSMFKQEDVTRAVTRFIEQNFEPRFAQELRFARGLEGRPGR